MNKFEAKDKLCGYLKRNHIAFRNDFDNGVVRITMLYHECNNCPDEMLESCIWFYPDSMECRVYYNENASAWCEKYSPNNLNFFRLLNYINATVFPQGSDGCCGLLYKASNLYSPRLYMTEDNCHDICITTIVPYDFYEVAPLETEDFLTACCPELLDKLSPAIFLLLLGEISLEEARNTVKQNVC